MKVAKSRSAFGRLAAAMLVAGLTSATSACASGPTNPDYSLTPQIIAVVGDFGSGRTAERHVADMVSRFNPSFVLTLGDNVYTDAGYETLVGSYYSQPIVAATGNHDYLVGIRGFDEFFKINQSDRTYVYQAPSGVDFFILDSTAGLELPSIRSAQRAWLEAAIKKSKANFKVVVLHHPPFSSAKHGSTKRYQWDYAAMGADLVLSGHDHTYERIVREDINYVVDGTGGAKLYDCKKKVAGSLGCDDQHYGALFLYANSYQLRGVFRGTDGKILDAFTIY